MMIPEIRQLLKTEVDRAEMRASVQVDFLLQLYWQLEESDSYGLSEVAAAVALAHGAFREDLKSEYAADLERSPLRLPPRFDVNG